MTQQESPAGADRPSEPPGTPERGPGEGDEHFKPVGTIFLLAIFVLTIILLWASVYVILISRGVTT